MVAAQEVRRAVDALLAEFHGFPPQIAERTREVALAAVDRWCWTEIGAPGIGDFRADLRGGNPFPWRDTLPNVADPESCGLDADGRVRVIRRTSVPIEQVIEYSPGRIRSILMDAAGKAGGIEDVLLEDDRYHTVVAVTEETWAYSRYAYQAEQLCSLWRVSQTGRGPGSRPVAMVMTPKYGRGGRLKDVAVSIDQATPLPEATAPPSPAEDLRGVRELLLSRGASEVQADEIVEALAVHLTPEAMERWLADPERAHPIPDPETVATFGVVMNWTAINAVAAGRAELVVAEARRFADEQT